MIINSFQPTPPTQIATDTDEMQGSLFASPRRDKSQFTTENPINGELKFRLKDAFKFSSPAAEKIIRLQMSIGENQDPNTMLVSEASQSQHSTIYITPRSIRIANHLLGQGGQGHVYEVERLFNDPNKKKEKEALKFSKRPFNSHSLLGEIPDENRRNLNFSVQSYSVKSETTPICDVLRLEQCDLHKFNPSKVERPVQQMLSFIKDVAIGANSLHQKDILHRDIKPENILISDENQALLGDLDLMFKTRTQEHFTTCTPSYSHPSIWGNDLLKQMTRRGIQTKADDAFSLGRTIQYGVIARIFALYVNTQPLVSRMKSQPFRIPSEESCNQLIQRSSSSNEILIVLGTQNIQDKENPNQTKMIPKNILLFPSRDDLNKINRMGLKILKNSLDIKEYHALHFTIKLAHVLQSDNPNERLSMENIVKEIENFQNQLQNVPSNPPPVSTRSQIEKRPLEAIDPSSSQKNKRV